MKFLDLFLSLVLNVVDIVVCTKLEVIFLASFLQFDKEQHELSTRSFVSTLMSYLYESLLLYNNGPPSVETSVAERQSTTSSFQEALFFSVA